MSLVAGAAASASLTLPLTSIAFSKSMCTCALAKLMVRLGFSSDRLLAWLCSWLIEADGFSELVEATVAYDLAGELICDIWACSD